MPANVADPRQSYDSEQILPTTIAHTQFTKRKETFSKTMSVNGEELYLVGPLSRLVGKPPFEPSLSKNVLPLTTAYIWPKWRHFIDADIRPHFNLCL